MTKSIILLFLIAVLPFSGCIAPFREYEDYDHHPAPDYSRDDAWACLPAKHNASDTVPVGSGLSDNQTTAQADVFFIYPTLDLSARNWNADIYNKRLNKRIDKTTIRNQATVFNGSCKVYSPRYRQATLYAFSDKNNGTKALNLAYEDVRSAFKYYMQHYNNGRPIIIAGHSQGTLMAYRLIKEFFDTTALKKQLVAAYLIGFKIQEGTIKKLCPCDSAKQTGCYIAWNTFKRGGGNSNLGKFFSGVCVNPLSWKRDTAFIDALHNAGSVNHKFGIDNNLVGAGCGDGLLYISEPNKPGYRTFGTGYHIYDYNFFYMNMRENVNERVHTFLKK